MRVFIDTSALFATLVRNDLMHVRGAACFSKLLEIGAEMHTTSYVTLKCAALLQARVSLEAIRLFHHEFQTFLHVHWVDKALHDRAVRRLELRNRRELSLVDCTSFVWMEENDVSHVFAYDKHFHEEGFTVFEKPRDVETAQK